jgi:hypothetical protein
MFEELEEAGEKKQSRRKQLWISASVIAALVVVVALVYVISRPRATTPVRVKSAAPAGQAAPPNPVRDLQLVHARMGKDATGVRVMWSVQLRNKSAVYTYTDLQYEATFIGADNRILAVSRDTIKDRIEPGEEKTLAPFMDGLYDARASTFQFVITGANATAR